MATKHIYGPYADRKGVTKTARKLSEDACCDTFVTSTANCKYQCWLADFPGDRPLPGYRVVETFRYVPPLPPEPVSEILEVLELLERLNYEVNENPSPEGDGAADADELSRLIRRALDLGLLDIVRNS